MLLKLFAKKLSKETQESIIDVLIRKILERVSPKKIILFGSASQLEMTDSSDLDVIVAFENEEELKAARKKLAGLSVSVGWPIDLLLYTDQEFLRVSQLGGVAMIANEDGKLLYSKGC